MTGPTPLSTLLRERTRDAHEQTEAGLNVLGPGLTLEPYARLLGRWHGFESTWQRHAPAVLGEPYFAPRRKLPLLDTDLRACGRSAADIAALPAVPDNALPFTDRVAALGILYVVEGSTLGGQYVAKNIRDRLGLTPDHGIAYFSSYGADVGRRWRETKGLLDAPPFVADAEAVVAGAMATFEYLRTWLTTAPQSVT